MYVILEGAPLLEEWNIGTMDLPCVPLISVCHSMESQHFVLKIVAIIMALCAVLGGVRERGISDILLLYVTEKPAKILCGSLLLEQKETPQAWSACIADTGAWEICCGWDKIA